jgi:hypothetical protein
VCGDSSRLSATRPASLKDGIWAANKFASEHDHYDLSYELSRKILPDPKRECQCTFLAQSSEDDPSPPWAYLTDDDDCVKAMRRRFSVHIPRQQVTAMVEPQTGVYKKDIVIKFYVCVIKRLIVYIHRLENGFFVVLTQRRWFPVIRRSRKDEGLQSRVGEL